MTVDRRYLAKALQKTGLTREQAARAVQTVLAEIHSALSVKRAVGIRSFGSFSFKPHRRGLMWDPRTGAVRRVEGGSLLRFRPACSFRRMIGAA